MIKICLASLLILTSISAKYFDVEEQCGIPSECVNSPESIVDIVKTYGECLELCQSLSDCNWITYFSEDDLCLGFKDCVEMDENCEDCISSEATCDPLTCDAEVQKNLPE